MEELRPLGYTTIEKLAPAEKMELVAFSSTSYFPLICKLMAWEVIALRDAAMDISPAKKAERDALMDTAHGAHVFFSRFQDTIETLKNGVMGEIKLRAIEEELKDQELIEGLILQQ